MKIERLYKRLRQAQDLLVKNHAYMAAAVLRLGTVHFTSDLDTAGIVDSGGEVRLFFNPNFVNRLLDEELAAVLVHEAMHFLLRHQARNALLTGRQERHLFQLCCEAVINDLITACFKELKLPGSPITGQMLVGMEVSSKSADEVVELLRKRMRPEDKQLENELALHRPLDDHTLWEPENGLQIPGCPPLEALEKPDVRGAGKTGDCSSREAIELTGRSQDDKVSGSPEAHEPVRGSEKDIADLGKKRAARDTPEPTSEQSPLADKILRACGIQDASYGSSSLGKDRRVAVQRQTCKDLSGFLLETIASVRACHPDWTRPNRKLTAVYPGIILPSCDETHHWTVLMAIDTSGSIPPLFLDVALGIARQKLPHSSVTLISFDTVAYEVAPGAMVLKGGGGTRVQAVEDYAREKMRGYPDLIIVLTDGLTPRPQILHPRRWVWILPPWGRIRPIPEGCRIQMFGKDELRGGAKPA